ncbi:MAG: serine/threonine protein kinase [Planctomycetes bacterium]|nr:serine/threonine protein kinase [Planctomycetota bacterium]
MVASPKSPSSSPSPKGLAISSRYLMLRKLGSGGTGSVYLVRDQLANRLAALKVLRLERLDPGSQARLQQEFSALANLNHPRLAAAYDFGYTESNHLPFFTREYIEGTPLAPGPPDARAQARPLEFLQPGLDLLEALQYLHTHEILHLDIHAGNLIAASDPGRGAVLIDFGFWRPGALFSMPFPSHALVAPELLEGKPPSLTADIYSAGRLLLYRLTGQYEGEPKLPREIPGWEARLGLRLERILGKALHRDPAQRFQSALEFREALLEAGRGEGGSSCWPDRDRAWIRSRPLRSGRPEPRAFSSSSGDGWPGRSSSR